MSGFLGKPGVGAETGWQASGDTRPKAGGHPTPEPRAGPGACPAVTVQCREECVLPGPTIAESASFPEGPWRTRAWAGVEGTDGSTEPEPRRCSLRPTRVPTRPHASTPLPTVRLPPSAGCHGHNGLGHREGPERLGES